MNQADKIHILLLHVIWCAVLILFALDTQAKAVSPDVELVRAEVRVSRRAARNHTPLPGPLLDALMAACARNGVPLSVGLGLIEVESGFQVNAVSPSGCYGLTQLSPRFFPGGLTPAQNITAGLDYLGGLLERYGDTAAALTAYHDGHDTGRRRYANKVLRAAERWTEKTAPSGTNTESGR